jgi:hypothetical protein
LFYPSLSFIILLSHTYPTRKRKAKMLAGQIDKLVALIETLNTNEQLGAAMELVAELAGDDSRRVYPALVKRIKLRDEVQTGSRKVEPLPQLGSE